MTRRHCCALSIATAVLSLAACGQKGPLYLPDPAPRSVPDAGAAHDSSATAPAAPAESAVPTDSGATEAERAKKQPATAPAADR